MSIDEAVRILNQNGEGRNYSKSEAKEIYEFIKMIAEKQVEKQIKKYMTSHE